MKERREAREKGVRRDPDTIPFIIFHTQETKAKCIPMQTLPLTKDMPMLTSVLDPPFLFR